MSFTKFLTEYEEIYRITYLRKFINTLKLLNTKNRSNRINIKCVLPNQAELAGSELLTPDLDADYSRGIPKFDQD